MKNSEEKTKAKMNKNKHTGNIYLVIPPLLCNLPDQITGSHQPLNTSPQCLPDQLPTNYTCPSLKLNMITGSTPAFYVQITQINPTENQNQIILFIYKLNLRLFVNSMEV